MKIKEKKYIRRRKKIFWNSFFIFIFIFLFFKPSLAQNKAELYLFYGQTCPVCAETQAFLGKLTKKYPLEIKSFEVFFQKNNRDLYFLLGDAFGENLKDIPVPVIFIGEKSFNGFNSVIATQIEQNIIKCSSQLCPSPLDKLKKENNKTPLSEKIYPAIIILFILIIIFLFIKRKK